MEALTWLNEHAERLLAILGLAYALALAVVQLTPTPRDDEALEQVAAPLRALALVFGLDLRRGVKAKPKPTPTKDDA